MHRTIEYIIAFAILILSQIFIFDNITIMGYVSAHVYIVFLMLLPIETKSISLIALGFLMGGLIDLANGTAGLCAMSATWIGAMRNYILLSIGGRDVRNSTGMPSVKTMSNARFWVYIIMTLLLYNIPYFMLESMTFANIGKTILRMICSSAFSFLVIYLTIAMIKRQNKSWQ